MDGALARNLKEPGPHSILFFDDQDRSI